MDGVDTGPDDMGALGFARYLNIRSATSPTFSHDGQHIFFLTDVTGTYQVWSAALSGGWPEQRTFFSDRVQSVHASPVEDRVQCGTDWGGNEHQQLYLIERGGAVIRPLAVDPSVIHHFGNWSPDGSTLSYASNSRNRTYFDIYCQDVRTGE